MSSCLSSRPLKRQTQILRMNSAGIHLRATADQGASASRLTHIGWEAAMSSRLQATRRYQLPMLCSDGAAIALTVGLQERLVQAPTGLQLHYDGSLLGHSMFRLRCNRKILWTKCKAKLLFPWSSNRLPSRCPGIVCVCVNCQRRNNAVAADLPTDETYVAMGNIICRVKRFRRWRWARRAPT